MFQVNQLPDDCIPYWDYDFVDGDEPRDASAGAISACGFLEMAGMMDDSEPDKTIFESAAAQLLEAIIDNCTGDIGTDYDGLICLLHMQSHKVRALTSVLYTVTSSILKLLRAISFPISRNIGNLLLAIKTIS